MRLSLPLGVSASSFLVRPWTSDDDDGDVDDSDDDDDGDDDDDDVRF